MSFSTGGGYCLTQDKDIVLVVKELKTEVVQLRNVLNMLLNMIMDSEMDDEPEYLGLIPSPDDYTRMYN